MTKTATRVSIAATPFSVFDLAGQPGGGTLAGTSVAAGVVPDDTVTGFPSVNAFGGSALGYLIGATFNWDVPGRLLVYDCLFKSGAYPFNANQALAAQPSFAARCPGGLFTDLELWVECVVANTGSQSVAVTYTNQSATAGRTTGTIVLGAMTVGQMVRLPLQAGDSGISKVESVVGTIATVGTFNVLVLRRLGGERINIANQGVKQSFLTTGIPQLYTTSAIYLVAIPDGTSTGHPDVELIVGNN